MTQALQVVEGIPAATAAWLDVVHICCWLGASISHTYRVTVQHHAPEALPSSRVVSTCIGVGSGLVKLRLPLPLLEAFKIRTLVSSCLDLLRHLGLC